MSFSSKQQPKKFGKGAAKPKAWLCGCDRTQPHYLLRCPRCGKGRP